MSMSVTVHDVVAAFPSGKPWTAHVPGTPPEIFDIEADFRGKRWTEIDVRLCNRHSDAYNMLELEPLVYFIPAFLRAAITDRIGTAAEFLVYFVCLGQADQLYRRLNDTQRDVFAGVVADLLANDGDYFASGEKEQFGKRLREWNAR